MKRRYSGFLLTLALMFAVILGFIPGLETAMTVHAEEESEVSEELYATEEAITARGTCGENLIWTLADDGTLAIYGTGYMSTFNSSNIPWQEYKDEIKAVIVDKGVVSIGQNAFYECENISTVELPTSLKFIRGSAFSGCTSLSKIAIPSSVMEIGSSAFLHCTSLSEITIPKSVTSIGGGAFGGCINLESIIIPNSVTTIGERAFTNCTALSSVTIPGSVKDLSVAVFQYCTSLKEVIVSEGVETMDVGVFGGCSNLEKVSLPSSLTNIPYAAFSNCEKLTEITISNNVKEVDSKAFEGCESLKEITIPNGCTYIGYHTFYGCENLSKISLPKSITEIQEEAFLDCSNLESIKIPSAVTRIGPRAFQGCSKLNTIIFEGSVPNIFKSQWYVESATSSSGGGSYKVWYDGAFPDVIANAYYPQSNTTWTKEVREANYGGKITWIGYESDLTTPAKPYKIANVVNGVHVYWNAVSGATKYGLWRSETGANGSYKWLGNPTTNHFTDTKVENGKTYYYCVSTCNPKTNAHSIMSEPLGITYVGTPDITDRMNMAAGVKLTWNKINGATGYAIYRKPYTGNAEWARVATISGNETFTWTDKSVASANGTIYRYTIRALAGANMKTLSGCRNTGRTMARLTSRTMNSVTKTGATSVKCTWSTTAQASGYEVRFMNGSTVVKQFTVGNYKTGAKTFTGIPAGANYKVQVRSYKKVDGVGAFYSAWSTPKYVNL